MGIMSSIRKAVDPLGVGKKVKKETSRAVKKVNKAAKLGALGLGAMAASKNTPGELKSALKKLSSGGYTKKYTDGRVGAFIRSQAEYAKKNKLPSYYK